MAKEGRHTFVLINFITRKRLDNVTSESNAMMYPLNDEKGEQMPVWLVDMLSNPLVNTLSDVAGGGGVDNGSVSNEFL